MSNSIQNISKIHCWFLAARPKTLLAALVPVMVGTSLAIHNGKFFFPYSLVALLCSILIQIGTNYTNDLYDHLKGSDTKERKGPLRVLSAGLISVEEMKIGIFVVFAITFLLGLYLVYAAGWIILAIGIVSIIAGLAYTAGPFPLAYNGLGDVFVFIFFGIVGTMGTYYLHHQEFTVLSFLISLPVGALITNILVVNNFRDIEEDRFANKKTLAVMMGNTFSKVEFIVLLVISFVVPIVLLSFYDFSYWILLPVISLPIALSLIKMLNQLKGTELNKTLELTAKFSALYGLLFSIGIII